MKMELMKITPMQEPAMRIVTPKMEAEPKKMPGIVRTSVSRLT